MRGWVSTFRDPGLYEMLRRRRAAGTRRSDDARRVVDAELARVRDERRDATTSSRARRRASSSALLQALETASGKAEQIGFYDTVLGDPAARVPPRSRPTGASPRATCGASRGGTSSTSARTIVRVLPEPSAAEAAQ